MTVPADQLALPTGQPRPCPACKGAGFQYTPDQAETRACPRCHGSGQVPDPANAMFPDGY